MAEDFKIEIDVEKTLNRFKRVLPDMTRQQLIAGMAQVVTMWGRGVEHNIATMFTGGYSALRPAHPHLADSLIKTVTEEGDLIVGEITYNLTDVPYARLLELGGTIPATDIRPKSATMLAIPVASFKSVIAEGGGEYEGEFVYAFGTPEREAFDVPGFHYILLALLALSKGIDDDLERAVAKAVKDSDFT